MEAVSPAPRKSQGHSGPSHQAAGQVSGMVRGYATGGLRTRMDAGAGRRALAAGDYIRTRVLLLLTHAVEAKRGPVNSHPARPVFVRSAKRQKQTWLLPREF